ncbi:MAG: hypothetical protein Fur0023_16770 [Bacteroidia bacterium]
MASMKDDFEEYRKPTYDSLLNSYMSEELALFIGAGVSRVAGCLSWHELGKRLIEECYKYIDEGKRLINYQEKENLINKLNSRDLISYANLIFFKNSGKEDNFYLKLKELLSQPNDDSIYETIDKLDVPYITTNADTIFDKFLKKENIVIENFGSIFDENLTNYPKGLQKKHLYKIHGSICKTETLVFTTSQYLERYNEENFQNFLKKVFQEYNVLFIGYGLNEFELLEYMFKKINEDENNETSNAKQIKEHYFIKGYFKYEKNLLELDRTHFYDNFKIKILPYPLDEDGYDGIKKILEELIDYIHSRQLASNLNKIDEIVNEIDKKT